MHILQLCLGYPPSYHAGGAAISAELVTRELVKSGYRVTVIAPKLSGSKYNAGIRTSEIAHHKGSLFFHCGTYLQSGFKTINPAAFFVIERYVRKCDLVIIHGLRTFFGTIGSFACWRLDKPYILFPHGMAIARWRSITSKRIFDSSIGRLIMAKAEMILCLSEIETSETLTYHGVQKSKVITTRFEHSQRLEGKRVFFAEGNEKEMCASILCLGRVVPEKGIDLLIEAIKDAQIKSKYRIIVGGPLEDAVYSDQLKRAAEASGIEIEFVGMLTPEQIQEHFAKSELLALVSQYESWGRVVYEALQFGVPVLVTETCGIARQITEKDGVVVSRNVEEIRNALVKLSRDKFSVLREISGSCGVDNMSFNGEKFRSIIDGFIQKAISKKGRTWKQRIQL
jgi:glycosyltransferase involved in cell wall biosynthesis